MAKEFRRLERIVRGFANHRRIEILDLLDSQGDMDLTHISRELNINFKTCSQHSLRLANAGLIYKTNKGQNVLHRVSPWGKKALVFLRTLE